MPAEDALQLITHTVNPNPGVVIDIGTLDDVGCSDHLKRIGRLAAGHPIGTDGEYA